MIARSATLLVISLALCGCVDQSPSDGAQQPAATAPLIELRLAHDEPAPGLHRMTIAGDTGVFYVGDRAVISDSDIQIVRPYIQQGMLILNVALEPEAAQRLATATGNNIGRRLAVLIDSQLITAGVIVDTLGTADVPVTVGLPLARVDAQSIVTAVTARWPSNEAGHK